MAPIKSIHAGADFPALAAQADATAFEQVGDGGNRLAVILRIAADRHDEISQAIVGPSGFFEVLFHTTFWAELLLDNILAARVPRVDFSRAQLGRNRRWFP